MSVPTDNERVDAYRVIVHSPPQYPGLFASKGVVTAHRQGDDWCWTYLLPPAMGPPAWYPSYRLEAVANEPLTEGEKAAMADADEIVRNLA